MKKILLSMLAAASICAAPAVALAQQGGGIGTTSSLTIPIVGSGGGATFNGTFDLQRFVAQNGQVNAVGTLTGTVTDTAGAVSSVVRNVSLPVSVAQATCDILHLDLGPLSLDLLGLNVDLSRIVLDITAESGPGNLLGNLLCSVAGLLDNPGGLSRLLNQILGILG
ncbi:MAG TPA: hypothetical protein VK886_20635 [Vicinamibacterales bacterium]|nr:hypothetical protein [Vicinamibacterales bacterium]